MRIRLVIIGCTAAAARAVAHAQQQPPNFGATTRTVAVYATVTDAQGRLAPDLTRDNFEVDDNGVKLHHQYALGFAPQKLDGKMHDFSLLAAETHPFRSPAHPFADAAG